MIRFRETKLYDMILRDHRYYELMIQVMLVDQNAIHMYSAPLQRKKKKEALKHSVEGVYIDYRYINSITTIKIYFSFAQFSLLTMSYLLIELQFNHHVSLIY